MGSLGCAGVGVFALFVLIYLLSSPGDPSMLPGLGAIGIYPGVLSRHSGCAPRDRGQSLEVFLAGTA